MLNKVGGIIDTVVGTLFDVVAVLLLWALRSVFPPERMERALRRLFGRRDDS